MARLRTAATTSSPAHDRRSDGMIWQHGTLSVEQIKLVASLLPADISFADENDILLFWSGETYKTCDARYIGRDIRDCHPEGSLEVLERILSAFKDGSRETAEGWHTEDGRFHYTRYIAVRDHGVYKGILETSMYLEDLRSLSGQQALPGW
jgi:hypothetical protein